MTVKEVISVIVPCHNEETTIEPFINEMAMIERQMPFIELEYLFVNDGSSDETLKKLKEIAKRDEKYKYLSFSRNFGKEAALFAGLEHANGDYVVVMDVDLQDPPHLLPEMYQLITSEDYDCIGTRRVNRAGEPPIRSFFAKKFYQIINKISNVEIVDGARDYRLMTRQMANSILEVVEYNRFSKGIFSWVGYNVYYLEFENVERVSGETSWSFWKLLKYSIDGIVSFSEVPLMLSTIVGLLSFILAIISLFFILIRAWIFGDPTSGWPSLVSIMLAIGGIQLLSLGIIGQYIGKMFLETKRRPLYIVKEKNVKK